MILPRSEQLKNIFTSKNGIHLTIYLDNHKDVHRLKLDLQSCILSAEDDLKSVLSSEELQKFLDPISKLSQNISFLSQFKKNIALFRTPESFRVLSLPVDVERTSIVATSFHIKPLIRWMQEDLDFFLLGINHDQFQIYYGNQQHYSLLDSASTKDFLWDEKLNYKSINNWIEKTTKINKQNTAPKMYIAGKPDEIINTTKNLTYKNLQSHLVWPNFDEPLIPEIVNNIRLKLRSEAKKRLGEQLVDFYIDNKSGNIRKNIFQIAKAAISGKIKKLVVSNKTNIFGTMNEKTGGLALHPMDLNHEDDDLLDDLAQTVLANGGEVFVVEQDLIPYGRPILALLRSSEDHFQTNTTASETKTFNEVRKELCL
jgi:hypothetical protein